jgi:hypothetical protein
MKQTTIYEVLVTTSQRRQRKLCFLAPPTRENLVAAFAAEITAHQRQVEESHEHDDEDGCYEHARDGYEREIEDLGYLMEVAAHAVWADRKQWVNGVLPVTIAGTRIGEIRVEELAAYKE